MATINPSWRPNRRYIGTGVAGAPGVSPVTAKSNENKVFKDLYSNNNREYEEIQGMSQELQDRIAQIQSGEAGRLTSADLMEIARARDSAKRSARTAAGSYVNAGGQANTAQIGAVRGMLQNQGDVGLAGMPEDFRRRNIENATTSASMGMGMLSNKTGMWANQGAGMQSSLSRQLAEREANAGRVFQAGQSGLSRDWQSGEAATERDWRSGEAQKARDFQNSGTPWASEANQQKYLNFLQKMDALQRELEWNELQNMGDKFNYTGQMAMPPANTRATGPAAFAQSAGALQTWKNRQEAIRRSLGI